MTNFLSFGNVVRCRQISEYQNFLEGSQEQRDFIISNKIFCKFEIYKKWVVEDRVLFLSYSFLKKDNSNSFEKKYLSSLISKQR